MNDGPGHQRQALDDTLLASNLIHLRDTALEVMG